MSDGRKYPPGVLPHAKSGIKIRWTSNGIRQVKTLRLPHTAEGIAEAAAIRQRCVEAAKAGYGFTDGHHLPSGEYVDLSGYYKSMFKSAEKRGAKVGYSLTDENIRSLIEKAGGRCMLTGIPFTLDKAKAWRAPYAPSIDRIDSSKGYSADNVRLVCVAVNISMNEWGEQVLAEIAKGYVRTVVLATSWRRALVSD